MPEQYTNNAETTLTAGYTAGAGSITVTSTAGAFPTAANFRVGLFEGSTLKVILKVTAITDGTHFAVTAEGTDANAANGATVRHLLTAAGMDAIRNDLSNYGTYANLPSTTGQKAGNRYKLTDGYGEYIFNGSAWLRFFYGFPCTNPPAAASFTTAGSGVSLTDSNDSLILTGTNNNWVAAYIAQAGPITLEVGILPLLAAGGTNTTFAICHSDATKYKYLYIDKAGTVGVQYNTAVNTFSATRFSQNSTFIQPIFFKIALDASNRVYYVGDGVNWVQIYTEAATTDLTTSKIGIAMFVGNQTVPGQMRVFHFKYY